MDYVLEMLDISASGKIQFFKKLSKQKAPGITNNFRTLYNPLIALSLTEKKRNKGKIQSSTETEITVIYLANN